MVVGAGEIAVEGARKVGQGEVNEDGILASVPVHVQENDAQGSEQPRHKDVKPAKPSVWRFEVETDAEHFKNKINDNGVDEPSEVHVVVNCVQQSDQEDGARTVTVQHGKVGLFHDHIRTSQEFDESLPTRKSLVRFVDHQFAEFFRKTSQELTNE